MTGAGSTPAARWQVFLDAFFAPPNELTLDGQIRELDAIVLNATQAVQAEIPLPVVLPAKVKSTSHYVAVAFDLDQARLLRELLVAAVGNTWTDFDGRSRATAAHLDELDHAAIALAGGDARYVFRFLVASEARKPVRRAVNSLMALWIARPHRDRGAELAIGRLLGDFEDACVNKEEARAADLLRRIGSDARVSAANRLFLHVRLLAAFERWDELLDLQELPDLLSLQRPALVSDSLARLALRDPRVAETADSFAPVAAQFGALVPSIGVIRSISGARYYRSWSVLCGESIAEVDKRLTAAGWPIEKSPAPRGVSSSQPSIGSHDSETSLRQDLLKAIEEDRLDAAVVVLSRLPPLETDVSVVVEIAQRTLTPEALGLLDRYREAFGSEAVSAALERRRDQPVPVSDSVDGALADLLRRLLLKSSLHESRVAEERVLAERGLTLAMVPGALHGATAVINSLMALPTDDLDVSIGLDVCLDLARDLRRAESPVRGVGEFGFALVELWAYSDAAADRRLLRRVLDLAEYVLELGLTGSKQAELVELLRSGWSHFLTDSDLPLGLDAIETLQLHHQISAGSLEAFALPILSRIGQHNSRRLTRSALDVAGLLASEFGLHLGLSGTAGADGGVETKDFVPPGTRMGIYTLIDPVGQRAASVLKSRHPQLEVVVVSDHVGTDRLRNMARNCKIVVVMDRAAKHAATDALRTARGGAPLIFSPGKGSTSLIDAAENALMDLFKLDALGETSGVKAQA